mgnify:CR=1 FL=1
MRTVLGASIRLFAFVLVFSFFNANAFSQRVKTNLEFFYCVEKGGTEKDCFKKIKNKYRLSEEEAIKAQAAYNKIKKKALSKGL